MDNQASYARVRERLEEIVVQVKSKDVPLEKSLDLYEEALRLGGICAEMIDRTDFSAEELESLRGAPEDSQEEGEDAAAKNIHAGDLDAEAQQDATDATFSNGGDKGSNDIDAGHTESD
jgi:exodeoxyribonuclease VII small subunit